MTAPATPAGGGPRPCSRCGSTTNKRRPRKQGGVRSECVPCEREYLKDRARKVRAGHWRPKTVEERQRHRPGRTIVVLSDVHVPEHDRGAWACALGVIRACAPDEVILAGDFAELESVSQHGAYNENRLSEDVVAVRRALNDVREAAGESATITYLEGNHETRLTRAIATRAPSLRGMLTLPELLDLDDRNVTWVPEAKQPVHRGLLHILHGHQIFGEGGGPTYHAAKALQIYGGTAGGVVTYGHTHKPQSIGRAVTGGAVRAVGLGCLRTIRPSEVSWLRGSEAGWVHSFAVFTVLDGSVHVEEIRPVRGQAVFRGRLVGSVHGAS